MSCQVCHSRICKCLPPIVIKDEKEIEQLRAENTRLKEERHLLAEAILEEAGLTGPQLLMLCDDLVDLRDQLAAAQADAARYRWLLHNATEIETTKFYWTSSKGTTEEDRTIDAEIDSAIQQASCDSMKGETR